jgi:hypothetical protein
LTKAKEAKAGKPRDDHGITCSCPRCTGLRLYPQPSLCDWCQTVHAGDASNCPEKRQQAQEYFAGGLDNDADRDIVSSVPRNGLPETGNGHIQQTWESDPQTEWIVSLVERNHNDLKRQIKKELKTMSMKDMLAAKGSGAGNLLKGSDVPSRIKTITIEVGNIREAPDGFTAPALIDLKKELYGATAWAVNKTNLKALIKLFGDDEKKLRGKKIKLDVISTRNPQSGDIVPSLAVSPRQ